MRTTVTAILVAEKGGAWLAETLEALAAQTLAPDRLIGVVKGKNQEIGDIMHRAGCEKVIFADATASFGKCIEAAEKLIDSSEDEELLWLLTEDSAPEPGALNYLFRKIVGAQSVALAGPKLLDWDNPANIVELGQGLTWSGSRWLLQRQELDQQQYDSLEDVLGVGPYGMMVRRSVWRDLQGFDESLAVWDSGLDFSIRARLAGHRVVVAPKARLKVAQIGIAGPEIVRSRSKMHRAYRQARTEHLHRRIAYAPLLLAPLYWLMMPLIAVLRVFWALMRERPGHMAGEFAAPILVFFNLGGILRSRKLIRQNNTAGWSAIKPLRIDRSTIRMQRILDREAILADQGIKPREIGFIVNGGVTVLIASIVVGVAFTWWLFSDSSVLRSGVIPLSDFTELWDNTKMRGGVPADPFTWVLAVLGSLTFWKPSLAIVGLVAVAIPLSALGGWFWGSLFSDRRAGRALVAFGWALSPVLLGSMAQGWIATMLLAIVLPWLLFAATKAHESWSWAGIASLLTAVALASAPVLIPAAVILWAIGILLNLRGAIRIITAAIAPVSLFAPSLIYVLAQGNPLAILRDPGIAEPYRPATVWQMFLAFPQAGLNGWSEFLASIGFSGISPTLIVGLMLIPLAILGIVGLYTGKVVVSVFAALLGGLGITTAVLSANTALVTSGTEAVNLWTGSGLALYWIALVTLAASGADILRKVGSVLVVFTVVCCLVVVAPTAVQLVTGHSTIRDTAQRLPDIVRAGGKVDKDLETLVITPLEQGKVRTEIIRGAGRDLDDIRSLGYTAKITPEEQKIARLVSELISSGSAKLRNTLVETGVDYIVLAKSGSSVDRTQIQSVLDEQTALHPVGITGVGLLWAVDDSIRSAGKGHSALARNTDDLPLPVKIASTAVTAQTVWTIQLIIFIAIILLALPTGDPQARPPKRKKRRNNTDTGAVPVVAGAGATGVAASEISEAAALIGNNASRGKRRFFKPTEQTPKDTAYTTDTSNDNPQNPSLAEGGNSV